MNIEQRYQLPNCTLTLEGFEDTVELVDINTNQPPQISILANADLHFTNSDQHLSGGRVFLENLTTAVSNYAQEFLSGLSHPQGNREEYPHISIQKKEAEDLYQIIFSPDPSENQEPTILSLTAVELFDLVEAVDQFYMDTNVLPDISLELRAVSKRFRQPEEPLADRIIPFLAGTATVAVAASALFMIPPPEIREPKPSVNNTSTPTLPVPVTPIPSNPNE